MTGPAYELTPCVVCGANDAICVAGTAAIRQEVEWLWSYHGLRLKGGTPPRRLLDRVAFSQGPPLRLARCRRCGLLYRNPIERARELATIYADAVPSVDTLRSLHDAQREAYRLHVRRLASVIGIGAHGKRRRVAGLEVGSYVGAFLGAAREEGLELQGLDVNPRVNAFTRSLGFVVHDGDIEVLAAHRQLDVVVIWSAFDQLSDPVSAAYGAFRSLRPGGTLAIRVPNGEFYARVRRALDNGALSPVARELLAQNNLLSFPYRFGFTAKSIRWLLARAGFVVIRVGGDVLVPTADEWTRWWARLEERAMKRLMRTVARRQPRLAPWLEIYARKAA